MPTFSANLGFLWQEHTLADAIRAAHTAGFNAVECHFPYNEPVMDVCEALESTSVSMLGLNTIRGSLNAGLAALPDKIPEARQAIDQGLFLWVSNGSTECPRYGWKNFRFIS